MFIEVKATATALKRRSIVCGIGKNDAWYMPQQRVNGKVNCCEIYGTWKGMIRRCSDFRTDREAIFYSDCTVCGEWLFFSNFYNWVKTQDWKGKHLDKDILKQGNKIYSPETCIFVDQSINKLIMDNSAVRGDLPQGVDSTPSGFRAKLSINGKHTHLGYFDNPKDAAIAYAKRKLEYISSMCTSLDDTRVVSSLLAYGNKLVKDSYAI